MHVAVKKRKSVVIKLKYDYCIRNSNAPSDSNTMKAGSLPSQPVHVTYNIEVCVKAVKS